VWLKKGQGSFETFKEVILAMRQAIRLWKVPLLLLGKLRVEVSRSLLLNFLKQMLVLLVLDLLEAPPSVLSRFLLGLLLGLSSNPIMTFTPPCKISLHAKERASLTFPSLTPLPNLK
jgi:hypothetical protein